jgi:hypothetical protein
MTVLYIFYKCSVSALSNGEMGMGKRIGMQSLKLSSLRLPRQYATWAFYETSLFAGTETFP